MRRETQQKWASTTIVIPTAQGHLGGAAGPPILARLSVRTFLPQNFFLSRKVPKAYRRFSAKVAALIAVREGCRVSTAIDWLIASGMSRIYENTTLSAVNWCRSRTSRPKRAQKTRTPAACDRKVPPAPHELSVCI